MLPDHCRVAISPLRQQFTKGFHRFLGSGKAEMEFGGRQKFTYDIWQLNGT